MIMLGLTNSVPILVSYWKIYAEVNWAHPNISTKDVDVTSAQPSAFEQDLVISFAQENTFEEQVVSEDVCVGMTNSV